MIARSVPIVVLLAVGCGYRPGSFAHFSAPFAGERVRTRCLDVAVRSAGRSAEGDVVGLTFGNRCDRGVWIDVGAVRVHGRYPDGSTVALAAFDPERVIRPGLLDGRASGEELIEYQWPPDAASPPPWICLDLAGLEVEAPVDRPLEACVASEEDLVLTAGLP